MLGEHELSPITAPESTSGFLATAKRVWKQAVVLTLAAGLAATINPRDNNVFTTIPPTSLPPITLSLENNASLIDETLPPEFYQSDIESAPLAERGSKTAIIQISGRDIEWPPTDDLLPASVFDDSIEKMAAGLDVTPEELSQDVFTVAPIGEPDTNFKYGNHDTFDPQSNQDFAQKLSQIRDLIRAKKEYGRVVILSTTHGGAQEKWFTVPGVPYEDFSRYLDSFDIPILYIAEECYAGGALSPWSGVIYDEFSNKTPVSNSVSAALLSTNPDITYIAVTSADNVAEEPAYPSWEQRNASTVILEAMLQGGSIIDSVGEASIDVMDLSSANLWHSTAYGQRFTLRQSKGNIVSRLSQPSVDTPYTTYSNYPPAKGKNIGSDAFPFGLYDLGNGTTRIVNYSNTSREITTNSGEKVMLLPYEVKNIQSVTSAVDAKGFEAFLPSVDPNEGDYDRCIVADAKYAVLDGTVPSEYYWERVKVPVANVCPFPLSVLIISPTDSGGMRFHEIDLDAVANVLPPNSISWFDYIIRANVKAGFNQGEIGFPFEISTQYDQTQTLFVVQAGSSGTFGEQFKPFRLSLPLVSR